MKQAPPPPPVPKRPPTAQRVKRLRARGAARRIPEHAPQTQEDAGLLDRPDGWYWVAPDGRQEFGPFDSAEDARADRDRAGEESVDEAEAEREAELDLGVREAVREGVESVSDRDGSGDEPLPTPP